MKISKGDKLAVLDSPEIEHQLAQKRPFSVRLGYGLQN